MNRKDFRNELYEKYVSTFKKFITNENPSNFLSEHKVFKKRYLPLLKDFPKNLSLLELGCGSGNTLQFLKLEGFENLYGIDISEQQIEIARSKGLNVEVKNIFDFFKNYDKKFDGVFALDFVEHFNKNELLDLFTGVNEKMNKNGILIIRTPNGQGLFPGRNIYGDLTHLTIFNPNSLTQILKLTGFNDIKFYETEPVPKNIKGIIRLILWKVITLIIKGIKIVETGRKESILTENFICTARK